MPADPRKIALYMQGTFDKPNPNRQEMDTMLSVAKDICGSGFGTVILGQWHARSDGGIYYNDTSLDEVLQTLKVIPAALKDGGSVRKVLITFGPFGTDFQYIKDHLEHFMSTIVNLRKNTAIDSLDWDIEEDYDQSRDLLVDLTRWATGLGMTVTAAPYTYSTFWTDILQKTNPAGSPGFAWWNLQLYGGASYPDWVGDLKGLVANPEGSSLPATPLRRGFHT